MRPTWATSEFQTNDCYTEKERGEGDEATLKGLHVV